MQAPVESNATHASVESNVPVAMDDNGTSEGLPDGVVDNGESTDTPTTIEIAPATRRSNRTMTKPAWHHDYLILQRKVSNLTLY